MQSARLPGRLNDALSRVHNRSQEIGGHVTIAGSRAGKRPFAAFGVINFRRFIIGQGINLVGSWVDTVAEALLILQLTNSGFLLGLVTAARYLPILLLTPYAGVIVDRSDKRKLLILTAVSLGAISFILGILVATDAVALWSVLLAALGFGCMSALDNPARQAFIPELVDQQTVKSAIALNSTVVNVGRAVGPLVAAVLATTVGLAWCFFVNTISFLAVVVSLCILDGSRLRPANVIPRARHQLREGLAYARTQPPIIAPLVMMAFIGTFAYEFEVSLPLLAQKNLGGPDMYPWLGGAFGAGSVIGGIYCALRQRFGRRVIGAAWGLAAALAGTALAPATWVAVSFLVVAGFCGITFIITGNSTIQLLAPPDKRGRVVALWSTAFLGSTPIGASIIGAVGSVDARLAVGLGAAACGTAAVLGATILRRSRDTPVKDARR